MTAWMERVARRLVPAPLEFDEWVAQCPVHLLDLIDQAHGRVPTPLEQRYAEYAARCGDPAAQADLARVLARARAQNDAVMAELEAEDLLQDGGT